MRQTAALRSVNAARKNTRYGMLPLIPLSIELTRSCTLMILHSIKAKRIVIALQKSPSSRTHIPRCCPEPLPTSTWHYASSSDLQSIQCIPSARHALRPSLKVVQHQAIHSGWKISPIKVYQHVPIDVIVPESHPQCPKGSPLSIATQKHTRFSAMLRFVRFFTRRVSAYSARQNFGAVGDGVTDDTVAIKYVEPFRLVCMRILHHSQRRYLHGKPLWFGLQLDDVRIYLTVI